MLATIEVKPENNHTEFDNIGQITGEDSLYNKIESILHNWYIASFSDEEFREKKLILMKHIRTSTLKEKNKLFFLEFIVGSHNARQLWSGFLTMKLNRDSKISRYRGF